MESFKLLNYEEQQLVLTALNSHACLTTKLSKIVRSLYSEGFDIHELRQISNDANKPFVLSSIDISARFNIPLSQAYMLSFLHNSASFCGRLVNIVNDIELVYCSDYKLTDLVVLLKDNVRWMCPDLTVRQAFVGSFGATDCTSEIVDQMCFPSYGDSSHKPIVVGRVYPKVDGIPIGLITLNSYHYGIRLLNPNDGMVVMVLDDDCGHRLEFCPSLNEFYARSYSGKSKVIKTVPAFDFAKYSKTFATGFYDNIPCDGLILVCGYLEFRLKFRRTYDLKYSGAWSASVVVPSFYPKESGVYEVDSFGKFIKRRYDKIEPNGLSHDLLVSSSVLASYLYKRVSGHFRPNFATNQDLSGYKFLNPTLDNIVCMGCKYVDPLLVQDYLYYTGHSVIRDILI